MPIDVEIKDECGSTISRDDGPFLTLDFVEIAPLDSVCFRFIDPWGDTTFNQTQIEVFLDELRAVVRSMNDPDRLVELRALLQFLEPAANQMHTYVKFIGD